jgi:hypothetical protein
VKKDFNYTRMIRPNYVHGEHSAVRWDPVMVAPRLMMQAVALTLALTITAAVAPCASGILTSVSRSSILICCVFISCILITLGF